MHLRSLGVVLLSALGTGLVLVALYLAWQYHLGAIFGGFDAHPFDTNP